MRAWRRGSARILSELLGTERQAAAPRGGAARERRPARRPRSKRWAEALVQARERMASAAEFVVEGTLNRMVGMTLEAVGCEAAVGGRCLVDTAEGKQIEAEVVGFSGDKLFLMPTGDIRGLMPGARVIPTRSVIVGGGGRRTARPRARRRRPAARRLRRTALHRSRVADRRAA